MRNSVRAPGRTALGALSLALGMTAVVVMAVIDLSFRGTVTGTVLGNAITVQATPADYLAAGITALLGAVSIADVLYINVRERSAEFALLRSTGWLDRHLSRLAAYEATVLAVLGAVAGTAAALGITAALTARIDGQAYTVAAACTLAGIGLALAAASVPIRMMRSIPAARLLAEE
jgi:ABC-type antimicrobial peptide transport system permease subunit